MTPQPEHYEARGFRRDGALCRRIYDGFVIDAMPSLRTEGHTRLEIRSGSEAHRIPATVATLHDLDTLLRILAPSA